MSVCVWVRIWCIHRPNGRRLPIHGENISMHLHKTRINWKFWYYQPFTVNRLQHLSTSSRQKSFAMNSDSIVFCHRYAAFIIIRAEIDGFCLSLLSLHGSEIHTAPSIYVWLPCTYAWIFQAENIQVHDVICNVNVRCFAIHGAVHNRYNVKPSIFFGIQRARERQKSSHPHHAAPIESTLWISDKWISLAIKLYCWKLYS